MKKRELCSFEEKYEPFGRSGEDDNEYDDEYDYISREGETPKQLDFQTFIILYVVPIILFSVYMLFFYE